MKLGIIREGKFPPDKRVPLTPRQCKQLLAQYPDLKIVIQPSAIRDFKDDEYAQAGLCVQEDLGACDVLLGVKEVPADLLIPHKTYLFFSHTYKKQPYNRKLLQAILQKKIRLIDYEMLTDPKSGMRLVGFGRYAGIVGAYNAFRLYGEQTLAYKLKPAHECFDRAEMEREMQKIKLPADFKIALTGDGRVARGAMEILDKLSLRKLTPDEFLGDKQPEPGYCQLDVRHYFRRSDNKPFKKEDFYASNEGYLSNFMPYAQLADMYIAAHFWAEGSPLIFSRADARSAKFNIKTISDISCDIDGPVASTIRPATIADPFYAYDPRAEAVVALRSPGSIAVSAVDNLPCELPRDASEDFGSELLKNVIPHFFNDDRLGILARASETDREGKLTDRFAYLQDYVNGNDS